ncbi:MAG: DUF2147 domain-containing protein [Aquabacterium sp.]|nr:DUF2147 domain-containing protein [Aquabacterium sp.]
MKKLMTALALIAAAGTVLAQATPVGLWKTIDDETKTEKSYVRITEAGGVLTGKVEKIADPTKQDSKCEKCSDERKDKPVLGMTIVRNARADADKVHWEGGEILDPNNGKVYRLRLKPVDGGKAMEVRGYIGPFFRNQQWIRVE